MWILIWLCETKLWWKWKVVWYGYRQTVYIKTDGIYKDTEEDVETGFDTSNYEFQVMPEGIKSN